MRHTHTCANPDCRFQWICDGIGKSEICQVDKAVSVNKEGPRCMLCSYIDMARNVAAIRGLEFKVSLTPQRKGE